MSICRRFAASALLALWIAPAAYAGDELYLRWDDCFGDGGVYNRTFACDSNSGTDFLIGSFRLGQTTDQVSGLEAIVYIRGLGYALSPWWDAHSPGGCRSGSVVALFSPPATSTVCVDPWSVPDAAGGSSYQFPDPAQAQIRIAAVVPAGSEFTVPAGQEFFAFRVKIDHAHTSGASTCSGCTDPICLAWGYARVRLAPGSGSDVVILGSTTPANGSNVTWQPGAVATTEGYYYHGFPYYGDVLCQSVTPARSPTWGAVKSLYR